MHANHSDIFDIVGLGFGPSNLALATAIDESSVQLRALFLEQKPAFAWHPHMLLTDTVMQISFLKDLATQRNPESRHTFVSYLKQHDRLADFINLKSFYPTRIEFNDYMRWVAERLQHMVRYGSTVTDVRALRVSGQTLSEVTYVDQASGATHRVLARNLVAAMGGKPNLPFPIDAPAHADRIWHSSRHLANVERLGPVGEGHHFVVVGRGQSAAEIVHDLHGRHPGAKVTCLFRGYGLKPADSSQFVNMVFDASFVDEIHALPPALRQQILAQHQDTNYAVVDAPLISRLYEIQYRERVEGRPRLAFRGFATVLRIVDGEHGLRIVSQDARAASEEVIEADHVVLATGYQYPNPPAVIGELAQEFELDPATGAPRVNRHYRVATPGGAGPRVYLQGCNEATHGLADTLLSNLSVRAEEILFDILEGASAATRPCAHRLLPAEIL